MFFCGKRPYATKFSLVWNILLSCCLRPFYIFCHILVIIICVKDHISRLMYQIKNIVFIYCISLCHVYLQVHIQKIEYYEKGQYFLSLTSESETHILYRFITQSEIFQAFIAWNLDDYGLQILKTQNSVSQKIWILHTINKKRIF